MTKTKTAEATAVALDPFAELAETDAPKARVAMDVKAESKETKKVVKRVVKKTPATTIESAIEAAIDPFAEPLTVASPVKKRAVKTTKAEKIEVVATETPKKSVKKAVKKTVKSKKADQGLTDNLVAKGSDAEHSPVFKTLAEPILPEFERENRARLQMQTPTRLYFYWSVKENPWHLLKNAFGGDTGSYTLVLKLTNFRRGNEEIHQADAEGNWWFDVAPDGEYQAEIGFYAPNRPYFRIIHSNTVETPRRSPSPHAATDADWNVSAHKFAEVLDVAGFSRDAFDVALAGDDNALSENVTNIAFSRFTGVGDYELRGIATEDLRYAMLAVASGATLENLRWRVSPALFAILQANVDKLNADKALSALREYFDIDEAELTFEQLGSAVYGASLVNFPRTLKTRRVAASYAPVSSHSIG